MSDATQRDIQESFFDSVLRERSEVLVYLINGIKLRGRIKRYDRFTLVLESEGQEQLIFKHAVSTVGPAGAREGTRRPTESQPFNAPRPARAGDGEPRSGGGAGEGE